MKLLRCIINALLVCGALWVVSSADNALQCMPAEIISMGMSSPEGSGSINRRSLSPWSWSHNTVSTRIPDTLWEAKCSSMFCSSIDPDQKENLNALPVYQKILVLNQIEGSQCYNVSYQSVAVGCTCVRAKTQMDLKQKA